MHRNGRPAGFAFLVFREAEHANEVVKLMARDWVIDGRKITVELSKGHMDTRAQKERKPRLPQGSTTTYLADGASLHFGDLPHSVDKITLQKSLESFKLDGLLGCRVSE